MGYLRHWVRDSLYVPQAAVAGGDRSEAQARSCLTPAPRYPSFPVKSRSSDPRALARSRSFSGFRVHRLSAALPLTMSRCSLGCDRTNASVCSSGPVLGLAVEGRQDSSFAAAAVRDC